MRSTDFAGVIRVVLGFRKTRFPLDSHPRGGGNVFHRRGLLAGRTAFTLFPGINDVQREFRTDRTAGWTLHRAGPNKSDRPRKVMTIISSEPFYTAISCSKRWFPSK